MRRSLADGRYRTSVTMPVSAGVPVPAELAFVVDVALPHVIALTAEISWPSDIHLLDGDRMRVLDSTRPLSPFHLYRGVVDQTVNIFGSASGMSCLASMSDAAVDRIAAHAEDDPLLALERFGLNRDEYRRASRGDAAGAVTASAWTAVTATRSSTTAWRPSPARSIAMARFWGPSRCLAEGLSPAGGVRPGFPGEPQADDERHSRRPEAAGCKGRRRGWSRRRQRGPPRRIVTPHAAWSSPESVADARRLAVETAMLYLRHGRLRNLVNAPAAGRFVRIRP